MILIADSGGTKTDWRLIDANNKITQFKTGGLNPYQTDPATIEKEIIGVLLPQINREVQEIYFYGAGCSSKKNIEFIKSPLSKAFPEAVIEVSHDLLAVARALCNHNTGIACVLGTGANSCLYDGNKIVDNVPSLAYVLGDEGSGSYLGKKLLAAYFRRELTTKIVEKLESRFDVSKAVVLENVYQNEKAGNYLAGFGRFIFQYIKDPFLYQMVYRGFELFFEKNVMKYTSYQDYAIHFTGSIAYYFSDILRQVANDKGITLKNVIESPIAGLTLYHQHSNSTTENS